MRGVLELLTLSVKNTYQASSTSSIFLNLSILLHSTYCKSCKNSVSSEMPVCYWLVRFFLCFYYRTRRSGRSCQFDKHVPLINYLRHSNKYGRKENLSQPCWLSPNDSVKINKPLLLCEFSKSLLKSPNRMISFLSFKTLSFDWLSFRSGFWNPWNLNFKITW